MNEIDQYVWCNNEVVNLIINTKLGETKKRNIKVKTDFDNVLFPMTDNELCSVLANLLDNAVDACEKVKESERWIAISIKDCSTYILIKIENIQFITSFIKVSGMKKHFGKKILFL